MTTGNKVWAFGHAVERVAGDHGGMIVYRHDKNEDDYAVRHSSAEGPRDFRRVARVHKRIDGVIEFSFYRRGEN